MLLCTSAKALVDGCFGKLPVPVQLDEIEGIHPQGSAGAAYGSLHRGSCWPLAHDVGNQLGEDLRFGPPTLLARRVQCPENSF